MEASALHALEPSLKERFAGAIHWIDTARITDPGELLKRLVHLFSARQGMIIKGDALALQQMRTGWVLPLDGGTLEAEQAVIALGPWSTDLTSRFGYRLPLAAKRGYHRHFENSGPAPLTRPVYVRDRQCLIVPVAKGIRVMTGVELAARDATPDLRQIDRMTACARRTIHLGPPLDEQAWLGARPACPTCCPSSAKHRAIRACGLPSAMAIMD